MKIWKTLTFACALVGAATGMPANADVPDVEIKFSDRIQENLKSIDRIELRREKFFRKYRIEGANRRDVGNLNRSRFNNTEFATERLIPEIDDFSVNALMNAVLENSLEKVTDADPDHTLVVEIENFWVQNYSLNRFSTFNTRMKGKFSLLDASGATVASEEIDTVLVPQFTGQWNYDGPEYAFLDQSRDVRIAPIFSYFAKRGIESLYPDADVPGPIFVKRQ